MTVAATFLVIVFLLAPIVAAIPVAFTPQRYLSLPTDHWSLRHFGEVLTSVPWLRAIRTSVVVGLASSLVAVSLATAFCIGIWITRPRLSALLIGMATAPMAIPPIISALALYFFVSRTGTHDSLAGTTASHIIMTMPFAIVTLLVGLSQVDRRTELAARNLGASLRQTVIHVIVPQIRGSIAASLFLCFVLSWEEVSVTLFVTGSRVVTLPRSIWSGLRDNVDPKIAAISVVMIAITVTIMMIKAILDRKKTAFE